MMCDKSRCHLVTMLYIERVAFQSSWPHYNAGRKDEVLSWLEAFVNANRWIEKHHSLFYYDLYVILRKFNIFIHFFISLSNRSFH